MKKGKRFRVLAGCSISTDRRGTVHAHGFVWERDFSSETLEYLLGKKQTKVRGAPKIVEDIDPDEGKPPESIYEVLAKQAIDPEIKKVVAVPLIIPKKIEAPKKPALKKPALKKGNDWDKEEFIPETLEKPKPFTKKKG